MKASITQTQPKDVKPKKERVKNDGTPFFEEVKFDKSMNVYFKNDILIKFIF